MGQPFQGTISIVSHGHGPLLRNLLADLVSQEGIARWLIFVTFNIDEPFDVTAFPELRFHILRNENPLGFAENHNTVSRHAQGELFLIVNPDIRMPHKDALKRIEDLTHTSERPVLYAPVVVGPNGHVEDSVRSNLSPFNLLRRALARRDGWESDPDRQRFFWFAGMFLIAPLAQFRALGGFDERFRLYCEDYDLSARWRIAGGDLRVLRQISIIHDARRDSHRSFRHMRWHLSSLLRVWTSPPFWRIATGSYGQER